VTVTDDQGASTTQPYTIIVNPALGVTPATVPQPAVNSAYSQQLTGTGGSGTGYTFAAAGLPPGLTISAAGLISGAPTTNSGSPYAVQVTATDDQGASTTQAYTIIVNPALGVTPATLPAATIHGVYTQQLGGVGGSGNGYTFTQVGLPPGLSLSSSGVLSGTPTTTIGSPYTVEVTVTDNQGASATQSFSFVVDHSTSAATIETSASPIPLGQSVTFTASVTSSGPASDVATGSVTFLDGDLVLGVVTLAAGSAALDISSLSPGPHQIKAVYGGDSVYQPSVSNIIQQSVLIVSTASMLVTPPTPYYGSPLTISLTVTPEQPYVPSGVVNFYNGETLLGTGTIDTSGTAHFSISDLPAGTYTFTGVYGGDDYFQGLTSQTNETIIAKNSSLAGQIVSSDPQVYYGQTVSFTATFEATSAGAPMTGTVSFYEGQAFLGTSNLVPYTPAAASAVPGQLTPLGFGPRVYGKAILPNLGLSVGGHVITAVYSGDSNYVGVSSETPVTIQVNPAGTRTDLEGNCMPDGAVCVTATVAVTTPGNPPIDGSVSFFDGDTLLGSAPVTGGAASLTTGVLSPGSHVIRAVYSSGGTSSPSAASIVINTNGPQVVGLSRFGYHWSPTTIVLTFNSALDPTSAQNLANYKITGPGRGQIRVLRATYDPATMTVTLFPAQRLNLHWTYTLVVKGEPPTGLKAASGIPLDGAGRNLPGTNFQTQITWRDLAVSRGKPAATFVNGQVQQATGRLQNYLKSILGTTRAVASRVLKPVAHVIPLQKRKIVRRGR